MHEWYLKSKEGFQFGCFWMWEARLYLRHNLHFVLFIFVDFVNVLFWVVEGDYFLGLRLAAFLNQRDGALGDDFC